MADPAEQRLAALRKRWEEDHSSGAFVPLAEEYRRLGRLGEAIAVLEQGMKAAPNYLSARIALGRCRLDLGDAAGACTILEQVLHQDPTQLVASKLLVEAYLRSRRPEQARERLNLYAVLNDRDPELDELRRRVQQAIRERDESAVPGASIAPPADAPVKAAPEPAPLPRSEIVDPAPAPVPDVSARTPAAAAPTPAPLRVTGEVFRLPVMPLPAPDLARIATPVPSPPVPRGTIFGGLGTPADRRRYVAALLHGGVFGQPPVPSTDAAEAMPVEGEAFSWNAVAVEEPEPLQTAPETGGPLEAPAPAPAEGIQPTATLGELYLSQGHRQEAQNIFERVLEAQPDNPAAREGLESARRQAEPAGRQGVTARKVALLQDFLKRVRGGSESHVS